MDIKFDRIEKGEGDPLILLHGNGESHEYFVGQIDVFSEKRRVIAVDTRGHGGSPRGTGEFSLERFADDLAMFMDEENIAKADILGFSDGGNIALLFALKYPEKCGKLIVDGADLDPTGVKLAVQIPIVLGWLLTCAISLFDKRAVRKREMLQLMVDQPHIKTEQLAAIKSPTLIMAGTRDMIRESHTKKIARSIPGARLAIIEGDHFIAAKNSTEFNRIVIEFLGV